MGTTVSVLVQATRRANLRKYIRRMAEIVLSFHLGTQQMIQIKGFPALNPLGVISVDREACWRMRLLVHLLRPNANVRERTTLVKGPAFYMTSMMQLIEDPEPVMQVRVSPLGFGNRKCSLVCVWINSRFIRRHPISSQCIQNA